MSIKTRIHFDQFSNPKLNIFLFSFLLCSNWRTVGRSPSLKAEVFFYTRPPCNSQPNTSEFTNDFRLKMPTFFTRDPKTAAHGPTLVWMSQRLQQKMSQRPSAPQAVSLTAEQEKALRQQGTEVERIRTEGWKLGAHQFQMKLKKQKNNLWFETVVDLCPLNLLILLKTLKKLKGLTLSRQKPVPDSYRQHCFRATSFTRTHELTQM
uniref:Uncharacterized protein n=1 Tax=Helianthus annuus TaxID=4232 RepID=A0A251TR75_HELAN